MKGYNSVFWYGLMVVLCVVVPLVVFWQMGWLDGDASTKETIIMVGTVVVAVGSALAVAWKKG